MDDRVGLNGGDSFYEGFILAYISVVLGILMGLVIPELFRWLPRTATDETLAFGFLALQHPKSPRA